MFRAQVRRVGVGLYKGLPAMLVGVPLQGAVRLATLDTVKADSTPSPNPQPPTRTPNPNPQP